MVCLIDQLLIDTNTSTTKSRTSEQSNIKYVTVGVYQYHIIHPGTVNFSAYF